MHRGGSAVYVLLSGGVDSAACVAFYLAAGRDVTGIFVDYGQAAARAESEASGRIAKHYGIPLRRLTLTGGPSLGEGLITGRNGLLLFAALMCSGVRSGTIAIGVHAATTYYDCSRDFVDRLRSIVDACSEGGFDIEAPFVDWFKFQIYDYAYQHGVPVHLTYSCELGTEPSCGKCLSCGDVRIEQRRNPVPIDHLN